MRKAYDNLTASGRVEEEMLLEPTHYYIRFLPQDSSEVNWLENDSTLLLYDFPLDYEIAIEGDWYHDPTIPDSLPTWQYTAIQIDYDLPSFTYELLDELYMVDTDTVSTGRIDSDFWDQLEEEAFRITGNLETDDNGRIQSKWTPTGRLTVESIFANGFLTTGGFNFDTTEVPLKNVKVRVRNVVFIKSTQTRSDGTFRINESYRVKVDYSLEFEFPYFKMTNYFGFSENFNGNKSNQPWIFCFRQSQKPEKWGYATVHNAAVDFHQQALIEGLRLPLFSNETVKIRPIFEDGRSNVINMLFRHAPILDNTSFFPFNDVRLFMIDQGVRLRTDHIYRVMMHELGHVTHYLKSPGNFILCDGITRESFAVAIEYYFTLNFYPFLVSGIPDRDRLDIEAGASDSWKYSPFFIDLKDTTNQRLIPAATLFANDNVENYTLSQMQDALNWRTRLDGVANHLANNYNNPTENNLNELVGFYQAIKNDN